MNEDLYNGVKLSLGNNTYSDMNVEKDEWGIVRNDNQIYVNTNNTINSDLLQLKYYDTSKQFLLGKVKVVPDGDDPVATYKNVYVKVVTGEEQNTSDDTEGDTDNDTDNDSCECSNDANLIDDPEYSALLQLLEVMEVQYEDQINPEDIKNTSFVDSGKIFLSTGFRFKYSFGDDETFVANCIRWKNFNTDGERFDGEVFLKVIEYEPTEYDNFGYAKEGEKIISVSINSINQKVSNSENQWYEWYFPKKISFKRNHLYVIIPHHDKFYKSVTTSEAKFVIFGTKNINSGQGNIAGIWTGDRNEDVDSDFNPIVQFCKKIPTTIIMKK